mgnify:CR=1 FL=1
MKNGFAFPLDTTWQKEFEASFLWDDTIDQASAAEDIKKDMQGKVAEGITTTKTADEISKIKKIKSRQTPIRK